MFRMPRRCALQLVICPGVGCRRRHAVDYLINFVMQISLGVYLTAPFVKTDLILIFPGRLKRRLLQVLASEGLEFQNSFFRHQENNYAKTTKRKKIKNKHNNYLYLA